MIKTIFHITFAILLLFLGTWRLVEGGPEMYKGVISFVFAIGFLAMAVSNNRGK